MEYRILGPLEVWEDGGHVPIGGGRQRTLLALLLLHANDLVTRERLIDTLWPDNPPESADKIVQNHVSALRKVLPAGAVTTRGRGYQLNVVDDELDLALFRAGADEGRRLLSNGDAEDAANCLREALSLWRGEPLADCRLDSTARAEATALDELRLGALELRLDADLALGRHAPAVGELESLVTAHPYRERFRAQLMIALYRSGRPADALAVYRHGRRVLSDELGLEPSASLRELEKGILTQDPALDLAGPPPREPPPPPAPHSPRRGKLAGAAAIGALAIAAAVAIPIVVLGGDGSGSAVEAAPNSLAVIDPASNEVVASVPVGVRPDAVAVGQGAVWVANLGDRTLTRIDPHTREVVRTITLGATPTGLAAGAGAVWVANALSGTVSRVDPGVNSVSATVPVAPRSATAAVTAGHGEVWTAFGDGSVARIDPRTNRIAARGFAGYAPSALAVDDAWVWVANAAENTVSLIDPRTGGEVRTITVGLRPSAVALGGGSAWVADKGSDRVTRLGAVNASLTDTIRVGQGPVAAAFGDGAAWVANGDAGTVSRIDPKTGRVVATIDVGNRPAAVAFGAGDVWVALQERS